MKKKFYFKFFVFAVIAALVTVTSCQSYDDEIDALDKKISALTSTSGSMKADLEAAMGTVKASVAAAEAKATAAQDVANAAKAAGTNATAAAAAAQAKADKAAADVIVAQAKAQAASDAVAAAKTGSADALAKAQTAANDAANALLIAQGTADGAQAAADKAQDALNKAGTALDVATAAALAADNAKIDATAATLKANALQIELQELLARVVASVDEATKPELAALAAEVEVMKLAVADLFGKRLTSITLVPESHINGIAAITFKSLGFYPQVFNANHRKYQATTTGKTPSIWRINDSKTTVVNFRLSPRYITKNSIGFPSFDSWISENHMTRAPIAGNTGVNRPIAPVTGQMLDITSEGILKLKVNKTVGESLAHSINGAKDLEKFYMVTLGIPIDKKYWTDEEITKGETPIVTSEGYRIHEVIETPKIKSTLAKEHIAKAYSLTGTLISDPALMHYVPYALDVDGKPVHYSDSVMLYESGLLTPSLVDKEVDWKLGLDLHTLVTVGTVEDHKTLTNWKEYGLEYRFAVAKAPYLRGLLNTDQQEFASIDASGHLSSRVYSIPGSTETAIGREPIIRATLINTRNGNEVVDQRYIKVKFVKEITVKTIPPYTFPAQIVSCDHIDNKFGTQQMNEHVYRQVLEKYGMSKEQFHATYMSMEIDDVMKGTNYLVKDGVSVPVGAYTIGDNYFQRDRDVVFYVTPDVWGGTTTWNLDWRMSPKAVGTINPATGKETYKISVRFKDNTVGGAWGDIHMDFIMDVKLPVQTFAYQGTYWKNGMGEGVFNVNPIVYDPQTTGGHGNHGNPPAQGASHIEADMMNGYIFTGTNLKPANMAQFIKEVGSCATVNFVFDQSRFGAYSHLAGYRASADGISLWKTTTLYPANPGTFAYTQDDKLASTIENKFGATPKTTVVTNPVLGSGVNEAMAQIRLHEKDLLNGTSAAKALIGKNVPVNVEVKYNDWNTVVVQKFEVHFIDPLKVNNMVTGTLTDAVVGGSFVDVRTGLTFTDWNKYMVAKAPYPTTPVPTLEVYRSQLFLYYAVREVIFNTAGATSSLKLVGGTYQHEEGITNGNLPTGHSLDGVDVTNKNTTPWTLTVVTKDPTHLRYLNNFGTPVNVDYSIFVDAKVDYKWGIKDAKDIKIAVKKAEGTPSP